MHSKRVFLLGPSHHYYLSLAATTRCDKYGTPLGDLIVDTALVKKIQQEWGLEFMSRSVDEAEHSLEMHLPYIYKMLSLYASLTSDCFFSICLLFDSKNPAFQSDPSSVPLIPVMVGNTDSATQRQLGAYLAPYLSDPSNMFVISSDFCHWGSRFRYTYYQSEDASSAKSIRSNSEVSSDWPIHESIKVVDEESMNAVESGSHDKFMDQLKDTGNTVCGRHPIGVFMAAAEKAKLGGDKGWFKFLRYERSELVDDVRDSSVSYCCAFAVL